VQPNVTGFRVSSNGQLTQLANSQQTIDPGPGPGMFLDCDPGTFTPANQFYCGLNPTAFPRSPAQISFGPGGRKLVVTVKGPNTIYVIPVNAQGVTSTPTIWKASGPNQPTYFGFAFDSKGHVIVSEPFGTSPTIPASFSSSVSSFRVNADNTMTQISASVPNSQGTSCWVVVSGSVAYVSNNATSNITSYNIAANGTLTLLNATAATGNLVNDMTVVHDGSTSFLYVINGGLGTIGGFRINSDGSLKSIGAFGGLPIAAGAQGLAGY
jgi:6-phosphogluconolactonase (cycloisomerase 2 family)